jgi:hypothetical protein
MRYAPPRHGKIALEAFNTSGGSMRELLDLLILALTALSAGWTGWKSRRILKESLGRNVREEDQTSLRTWMQVPSDKLEAAARELQENPFEVALNVTGREMGGGYDDLPSIKQP